MGIGEKRVGKNVWRNQERGRKKRNQEVTSWYLLLLYLKMSQEIELFLLQWILF